MIPQTGATLLAFVFLVVPGIIFELLRRTRRPSVDRSPFEEFAVAVISSAAFTLMALAVLATFRAWFGRVRCQT